MESKLSPEESKNLLLLEKVLMRFALEEDSKLEAFLAQFLIPVLQNLNSNSELVRRKVLEVLSGINRRIKFLPTVKLPLRALLDNVVNNSSSVYLVNFSMIYLEMGFGRAPIQEQIDMVPELLRHISHRNEQHRNILLHMTLQVIDQLIIPSELNERKSIFSFVEVLETHSKLRMMIWDVGELFINKA